MKAARRAGYAAPPVMDASRYQRLCDLVHEATPLRGAARADFLDRACAGDPDLRAEAEALLAGDVVETDVLGLELGDANTAAVAPDDPAEGLSGQTLAGYELGPVIGRGGMADVFRAIHRPSGSPVALKVITGDVAQTPEFSRSFHTEVS